MVPFPVLEREAQRRASLRSTASEISDLVCDVVYHTDRVEELTRQGATSESVELARIALKEGLLALAVATERMVKLTEASR